MISVTSAKALKPSKNDNHVLGTYFRLFYQPIKERRHESVSKENKTQFLLSEVQGQNRSQRNRTLLTTVLGKKIKMRTHSIFL